MIPLPEPFLKQMQDLLNANEYEAFSKSYLATSNRGIRVNQLKIQKKQGQGDASPCRGLARETFATLTAPLGTASPRSNLNSPNLKSFDLNSLNLPVPWCKTGLYYFDDERPAKSLAYHAGLFYIQEPSAMCPAEVLGVERGHRVLDVCAAPGGKSVQIAGHLGGEGLLVSNDASATRCRALVKNLERAGVTNAVVVTEQPKKLAERFEGFFDRILVDAPCSGEGMFRRDSDVVKAYTANKPEACAAVQTEILRYAATMLKAGGRIVYSTCTFNPIENEGVIAAFLERHKDFSLVKINHDALGIEAGRGEWICNDDLNLNYTARIWPHLTTGEGHFIALLEAAQPLSAADMHTMPHIRNEASSASSKYKKAAQPLYSDNMHMVPHIRHEANSASSKSKKIAASTGATASPPREFSEFCEEFLRMDFPIGAYVLHGVNLYFQSVPLDLHGLRVARSGWHLGECLKGRFVPSQALAMGLCEEQSRYSAELSEVDAFKYMRGESLHYDDSQEISSSKPWVLICHDGFPLGWARLVQGRLKNNLPVGWAIKV
ncbi:MAG: RsmB/NOP family class I SAM-dependent RNA methyltransferase [Defluviitaleaceae bacterium]|nr:RsmB/NOP family class I SAM-dependent RNA methyltransferase [Defluviitaleaceae bacterium]